MSFNETNSPHLQAALKALDAGLSCIPPKQDGTKAPFPGKWKTYQESTPTNAELRGWYSNSLTGVGLVTGAVSGNLECLDFDTHDIWKQFKEGAKAAGMVDLVKRIGSGYAERSPNGFHLLYYCSTISGNTKLAQGADNKTLIETRGEGGFIITAPTSGPVNSSGDYTLKLGGFDSIETITPNERKQLLELARSFDQKPRPEVVAPDIKSHSGTRPGDDFAARTEWGDVLTGWAVVFKRNGTTYWRRPGKKQGVSATTNHDGSDLLYVFSTNTGFDSERGYNRFSAYTLLNHGGDFQEATKELGRQGYGDKPVREQADLKMPDTDAEWHDIIPLPERGDMGEAEPYRIDLLPESIQKAACEVSRFSMVPETSPAVVGVSVLAAAIGKKAVIVEREGLEHYPALFNTLIAYSGERKSPPFKKMTYPLEQWAEDQHEGYESLKREAKAMNEIIDAQAAALKSRAKKEGADMELMTGELADLEAKRIQPPPFPSMFTTDSTEQRLFQKLHDRAGAYAVMSGEGRPVLDAIMGKYSGDGGTGDAVYLAGISGDTITRDRVGGDGGPEERVITSPCLNVCIMVQQGKYLEAASHPAIKDSGALARIWPVWLPTMAGSRIEQEDDKGLNTGHLAAYNRMVREVLDHESGTDGNGRTVPHKARLSPEAVKARREFHNAIEANMAEGEDLEDVRDIASKAVSQTCKLALVLHIAEDHTVLNKAESTISPKIWAVAQTLGTYHLTEAVRVQRLADEDRTLESARRVLRWLQREGIKEITATVLAQQGPRPRLKAADAGAVLDMLADRNYLKSEKPPGKRKPVYTLNPAYLASLAKIAGGKGEK